ncbi:hypothetical protein JZ751_020065 [Albula glossodonta]|uniref:Uncharacterized protein n=1 Tax=Albula glossodonta TaxID=121402 RepID=A0A8T2NTE1_9TELE|nr:hypothetical protein JZ751_020065 [Albula glossodonta]
MRATLRRRRSHTRVVRGHRRTRKTQRRRRGPCAQGSWVTLQCGTIPWDWISMTTKPSKRKTAWAGVCLTRTFTVRDGPPRSPGRIWMSQRNPRMREQRTRRRARSPTEKWSTA